MCLVAIAHRASATFPLIIAANREEDYERPTLPAHWWTDDPDLLAGRDELQRGTWLAINRDGRFAAVTNLRGVARDPQRRSRGELVTSFVRGESSPAEFAQDLERRSNEYPPFHLYAGRFDRDLALMSESAHALGDGVHALSNAPFGELWPKVVTAQEFLLEAARSARTASGLANDLLRFLTARPTHGDARRDIFIIGDRYGTRSSTVIVASSDEVLVIEQTHGRGGMEGERREFAFRRGSARVSS